MLSIKRLKFSMYIYIHVKLLIVLEKTTHFSAHKDRIAYIYTQSLVLIHTHKIHTKFSILNGRLCVREHYAQARHLNPRYIYLWLVLTLQLKPQSFHHPSQTTRARILLYIVSFPSPPSTIYSLFLFLFVSFIHSISLSQFFPLPLTSVMPGSFASLQHFCPEFNHLYRSDARRGRRTQPPKRIPRRGPLTPSRLDGPKLGRAHGFCNSLGYIHKFIYVYVSMCMYSCMYESTASTKDVSTNGGPRPTKLHQDRWVAWSTFAWRRW